MLSSEVHNQETALFLFGNFRIDLSQQSLAYNNEFIPLPPKVFQTLLILVQNNQKLVTRDEIINYIWPNTFVEDHNLNANISTLRRILNECVPGVKFIETVPKRGYRFVADVQMVPSTTSRQEINDASTIPTLPLVQKADELSIEAGESFEPDSDLPDSFPPLISDPPVELPVVEFQTVEPEADLNAEEPLQVETKPEPITEKAPRPVVLRMPLSEKPAVPHPVRALQNLKFVAILSLVVFLGLISTPSTLLTSKASFLAELQATNIAVLPFKVIGSGDPALGVGAADTLITQLGQVPGFTILSGQAVENVLENRELSPTEAARLLRVQAVIEGSLQLLDGRLRATVRMFSPRSSSPVWTEVIDFTGENKVSHQDQIARRVARILLDATSPSTHPTGTSNETAYRYVLNGRYHWSRRDSQSLAESEACYRRALQLDPQYAEAYLGLADNLIFEEVGSERALEAWEHLQQALKLNPKLGEAYATLGFIQGFHQRNWNEAEVAFRRALELSPNSTKCHHWYAYHLAVTGRINEAIREMKITLALEPTSPNFLADLGQMCYFERDFEGGRRYCRRAWQIDPYFYYVYSNLNPILAKQGNYAKAMRAYELEKSSFYERVHNTEDVFASDSGDPADITRFREALRKEAEMILARPDHESLSYKLSTIYAQLGETEQSCFWLAKAIAKKQLLTPFANIDPIFDPLRDQPEFSTLLAQMNLGKGN
ncbi:MAG TPA: winged helix-turn-helix domain-containing protein [Acidobacteriota bacterium]|nr:winged helix-turn-helix domain-containing protein [Acidobacteriota bacterium]